MQADIKEWLKSTRPTIIFGAGRQGAVLYEFCKMYQKPCIAIMTSGSRTRWGSLPEEDVVPHATPGSYAGDKQNVDIVGAIGGDISGIVATLLESGYKNIFVSDDWNVSNDNLLRNFYESYVCARGGDICRDSEDKPYWHYTDENTCFKIYYPVDEVYDAALLGDAGNILLPSIFHDDSCIAFGSYELSGVVELSPNDVVLDIGAGIGDFSSVAVARGCRVYAVEPNNHGPLQYLQMNAKLYPKAITIVPKALYDTNGTADFYYNHRLDEKRDITCGTLNPAIGRFEDYAAEKVETVTLDSLVEEQGLEKIDYIKVSIPVSELIFLLKGATKTIQEFSPNWVFSCDTRDFKRNREVIAILRNLEPRYHFSWKGNRLFAWISSTIHDNRIAICGMGTIAQDFYEQHNDEFRTVCFIDEKPSEKSIHGIPVYSLQGFDTSYGAENIKVVVCKEAGSDMEAQLQRFQYRKGVDYFPHNWLSGKRIDYFLLRQFVSEEEALSLIRWLLETTGKKLAVYWGNCQSGFMKEFLIRCPIWYKEYILLDIPQVHRFTSQKSRFMIDEKFWELCSVLLYNHVGIENRFAEEFATDYIVKKVPRDCLKITIPYAFFRGYHPQTYGARKSNSNLFTIADKYVDCLAEEGKSANEIVEKVLSPKFLDKETVMTFVQDSLHEMRRREMEFSCNIIISDYIEENYRQKQLFHSPAHPIPELYVVMAKRVLSYITGVPFENIHFEQMDYLLEMWTSGETLVVYPSVKLALGLKQGLKSYCPNPNRKEWSFSGDVTGSEEYIRKYLEICWHIS